MVWVELDTISKRLSHSWERKQERKKKEERKKERKNEEPVSFSELNKLLLHPMQTLEISFYLEMNRLGDSDADDCFLFLTCRAVGWRPCCVYHKHACIFKSQHFFRPLLSTFVQVQKITQTTSSTECLHGGTALSMDLSLLGNNEQVSVCPVWHWQSFLTAFLKKINK